MKIIICIATQKLTLMDNSGNTIKPYPVSTAYNGTGELFGSFCTPRGKHYVRAKIGGHTPYAAVFRARRWTGEICNTSIYEQNPDRDWILSRILWLCGMEKNKNRLGKVDTFRRFIYIHGTPDSVSLDKPMSHGCIRMRNDHIIELFNLIPCGCDVDINEM